MGYVKLEPVDADISCPHCTQTFKIVPYDRQEFSIMSSLNSFNTNVRCTNCSNAFVIKLKDNKWSSSKTFQGD